MPDYQKNKNYKLCCKDPNIKQIYVGSTCNFRSRKTEHKSRCNNEKSKNYNTYVYQFIRNNGDWENWDMIEIEPYPCNNKREKETRERYWIEELKAELNKVTPTRNKKERYELNKEKIYKQHREYLEKNIEKFKNNAKLKINCICGSIYSKCNKSHHERTKKHLKYIENLIKPSE